METNDIIPVSRSGMTKLFVYQWNLTLGKMHRIKSNNIQNPVSLYSQAKGSNLARFTQALYYRVEPYLYRFFMEVSKSN